MSKLRILELFSGIGALTKALERLNIDHEIVDAVEIDKYAVKSFNAIHNTNFEPQDICEWDKDIEVDLIMHGSPCQDFSLAGKQAGGDKDSGTRSSLMYETIRIVEKLKPKYVIWENVKNLLSKKHIHNFDAYLETMEQLGYINYYQVLNAKDYGIPQNRERVFTVSILGNENYNFPNKQDEVNLQDFLEKDTNIKTKPMCEKAFDIEYEQIITSDKDIYQCNVSSGYQDCKVGIKVSPTIRANNNCTHVLQRFEFPPKKELKLKLKDMLENEVDEKYYLSEKMIDFFYKNEQVQKEKGNGFKFNVTDGNVIAKTITTRAGSGMDDNFLKIKEATKLGYKEAYEGDGVNISSRMKYQRGNVQKESIQTLTTSGGNERGVVLNDLRIRKLTPLETWRLMGFDDEDFEKAAFKKETSYIEGGIKCNAKLKIVNEKQRLLDVETYVLCTTNDMLDMETTTQTKWKKSIENENNEKMQNVNIAIEMLGDMVQKECATNIIKCGENTTILYTLMEELDQHHMAIIELEKRGKANIEKYMKITLEENLNPMKLYTISTLIEQIIRSKIYTCITQKANIQGNIAIIEDCVKNLKMMKLSNLKMEYITRLNSDTMLYKQAGNSIVVNVLEAILKELLINE